MIKINLLPHREEAQRARRQQFYAFLGLVALLAALIWLLVHSVIGSRIEGQTSKNDFLRQEISRLDRDIAEIKKLKAQTDSLLARKKIIEALQANRTEIVHLFNTLATQVPEGIYLRNLTQTDQKIAIAGVAQSNARITTLMNNFDESPLLENSTLIETRAEVVNNRRLNAFSINTFITRQTTDDRGGTKK